MQITKRLTISIITVILVFSLAVLAQPAPAQAASYNDINYHWARDAIVRWEALGALADFPSGSFRPDTPITRAEFFSILTHVMEATEVADISQFTDVAEDSWYYNVVALANQMGIANGASATAMKPTDNIIRQDAATLVARALGLPNEDGNYLYRYNDGGNISDYARNYVSVITEYGYMTGSYGSFNPRAYLSRAEAVKIIDNLFTHYYRPEVGFDNFTLSGNVLATRAEAVFNNLTIHGDLILGDGVGDGNVTLNNCVINGRLLVRGGGPNSVVLNNTKITDGITIISPSSEPRIVTTGSTTVPQLNAFSNFTLVGTGVHAAAVLDDAFVGSFAVLQGVVLDTLYVGGVGAKIDLREGRITNLHVAGAAESATINMAQGSLVDYLSTVSPNTSLTGAGRVSDAFINAPGAVLAMTPDTYTVGASLSALIAGATASGKVLETANTVIRDASTLAVSQDSDRTGGEELRISSAQGRHSNTVLVTQTPYAKIPLEHINDRWGYYIGFFIPSPGGSSRSIDQITYRNSDGGLVVMESVSLTRKGGVYGLEFHIPVTRAGAALSGRLKETMYIQWNSQYGENLQFHSGWLALEPLTGSQESRLIEQYSSGRFYGYDGTRYNGAEALQRLLASDNPLGLDTQGFADFTEADQEDLAKRLFELGDGLDTKEKIQGMIKQVVTGKAALYAVNNAVTRAQLRSALESTDFAKELNIEVAANSLYGLLAQTSKERVATVLLTARTKDYADSAAVKTAFDKAVADIRAVEINLLVALNAAKKAADAQKLVETKANADLLQFLPGEEPYKSLPADLKLDLGQRLLDNAPYYSADRVKQIIDDFMGTVAGIDPPVTITGIKVDPTTTTVLVGQSVKFSYTVTTTTGDLPNYAGAAITNTTPNFITLDEAGLAITGIAAGSGKVTVSVTDANAKKTFSATITVTVKVPVPSTSLTLSSERVEVEEGADSYSLKATMLPAATTDTLSWSTLDTSIATVKGTAGGGSVITGVSPGLTNVVARTSSGLTATAQVIVVSKDPGVMMNPEEITIGIGQTYDKLEAIVSPLSIGEKNRGVRWKSMDLSVATVDPYGRVTGVAVGDTEIIATSIYYPNEEATCIVYVDDSIKRLTLNTRKAVMVATGIEHLTATVIPNMEPGDKIIWGVRPASATGTVEEAREIATIKADIDSDPLGDPMKATITAHKAGTVYVYAYLESDSSAMAECEVQVLAGDLRITFPGTLSLYAGDRLTTAIPVFNPSTITNKTIKWSIANPEPADPNTEIAVIERVNANGSITIYGKKAGTVVLTGEPEAIDNLVVSCKITVSEIAVTTFSIIPGHIYMDVGNVIDLTDPSIFSIRMLPANATNKQIEWTGDNSGRVLINNPPPTAADPYGPSTLEAVRTTYSKVEKMVANPDGTFSMVTEWVDDPMVLVAKAVGAANNVREVTILVSINPSDTNQVNNIKIALERWVYPVGVSNQYMTVHFNVKGRAANGDWELDLQPPNRKLTWSSENADIAYVTDDNRLVTLKPGKVNIMATSQDGGRTDTVTIVVEDYGVNSMSFSGLSTTPGYGKFLQMLVGEEKDVTANISPTEGNNTEMVWMPYQWLYTNDADTVGHAGSTAFSELPITQPLNYRTGHIKANAPGLYQVSVQPTNPNKIGLLSINKLEQVCNDMNLSFTDYLDKNGIVREGAPGFYTYYSPNEVNLNTAPKAPRRALNPSQDIYLVMPHQIEAGSNQFFVWVTSPLLKGVAFDAPPASVNLGNTVPLTAKIDPALNVNITNPLTDIVWAVTGPPALTAPPTISGQSYNQNTGTCYATLNVPQSTDQGTYTVTVSVTSASEYGLKSTVSGYPRQTQNGDTKTDSFTVTVATPSPMPPRQAAQAVQTPVETPPPEYIPQTTTTTAQPTENNNTPAPVETTTPVETPAPVETTPPAQTAPPTPPVQQNYIDTPIHDNLSPVAVSKILGLRKAATVKLGSAIRLVPVLSAGNYDLSGLTWISSKPDIATVDASGVVTGIKAGKAVITVSVPGTKLKASCTVNVAASLKIPVSGISLSSSALTLEEGKAAALKLTFAPTNATAKTVSWLSSDSSVATVDAAGKVTAIAAGSATITVISDDGGYTASCSVTVTPKPVRVTGITLNCTTLPMMVGEEFMLEYIIAPENAANQEVRWVSSNAKVVTVVNGQLTALKKGNATITVITADGSKRATCKVTVK